jgi:MFS family permease
VLVVCTAIVVFGVNELGWAQHIRERVGGAVARIKVLPGTVIEFQRTAPTLLGCALREYLKLDLKGNPNFTWLAISRFVIHLGYCLFQAFVAYFAAANLDGQGWLMSMGLTAEKAQSLRGVVLPAILLFFLLGGLAGNLLSVPLARRFGKKWVIGWSLAFAGTLFIPLIFDRNVWVAVSLGLFIGMAWGAFIASDWAFATTLMPKQKTGTYMGLWDFTTLMPQVLAPILGGPLRDWIFAIEAARRAPGVDPQSFDEALKRACEAPAYQVIFATIIVWFGLGIWLLRRVKEERPANP